WCVASGFCQTANPDSLLSAARQELYSRVDIYPVNNMTFSVSFSYSDPAVTLHVTQDINAQVIQSLLEVRTHTLSKLRDAIQKQAGSLQVGQPQPSQGAVNPLSGSLTTREQLEQIRRQIRALSSQYTEEHPLVKQLQEREHMLLEQLVNSSPEDASGS